MRTFSFRSNTATGPPTVTCAACAARLNSEFPGATFYFLPADIVNQTINFGLPAPFDIQIVGRDRDQKSGHRGKPC